MQCVGSTQFLKSFYGAGYKLIFDKSPNINENHVENLSNFVKNYIPDATKIEEAGAEEYFFIFIFIFLFRFVIVAYNSYYFFANILLLLLLLLYEFYFKIKSQ
jgi:hypothetical protein